MTKVDLELAYKPDPGWGRAAVFFLLLTASHHPTSPHHCPLPQVAKIVASTLRTQLQSSHAHSLGCTPRHMNGAGQSPSQGKDQFRDWSPGRRENQERVALRASSPPPTSARADWVHWTYEAGGFLEEEFD